MILNLSFLIAIASHFTVNASETNSAKLALKSIETCDCSWDTDSSKSALALSNQIDQRLQQLAFDLHKSVTSPQTYSVHAGLNSTFNPVHQSMALSNQLTTKVNVKIVSPSVIEAAYNKNLHAYQQTIQREPHRYELIQHDLRKLYGFIDTFGSDPLSVTIEDQLRFCNLQTLVSDCFPHVSGFPALYEKQIFVLNKYQEVLFPKNEFHHIAHNYQIQQIANIYAQYLKTTDPYSYMATLKDLSQNNSYFKSIYQEAQRSKNPLEHISIMFKQFGTDLKEIHHENYNFLKVVPSNAYNSAAAELSKHLQDNDFQNAKKILNKYNAIAQSAVHLKDSNEYIARFEELKSIYQQAYAKEFNEHGINRYIAAIDPYYQRITEAIAQGKLQCQQHSTTAEQLNAQLLQRYNEAKQMIAFGNGNQSDPKNLQIAYAMIDNKDNLDLMIDYLAQFSKDSAKSEDRSIFNAFCTDAGLPRYLLKQNGGLVDGMQLPAALGLEANADLRSIACKALVTDASTPEAQTNIAKTIDYIREACSSTPLAKYYGILARTLFNEYKHENTPRIVSELTHLASKTPLCEQQELKEAIIPRITERLERFGNDNWNNEKQAIIHDIRKLNEAYIMMNETKYAEAQSFIQEVDHPELLQEKIKAAEISKQNYEISPLTAYLLEQYKADPKNFAFCEGNIVQQQIHTKVVNNLNHAARLYWHEKSISQLKPITSTATRLTLLANDLNKKHDVYKSTHILKLCDRILKIGDIVYEGLKGVSLGVMDAAISTAYLPYNLGHALAHPVQTSIGLANGLESLTSVLSLYIPPDYSIFESDPHYIEMYHRIMQTQSANIDVTLELALEAIKQSTIQDITRAASRHLAEGIFATQAFKGVGLAGQYTKNTAYFAELVNQARHAKERVSPHVKVVIDKIKKIEMKTSGYIDLSLKQIPEFIRSNRVPLDHETILHSKDFNKTKIDRIKGATVYKNGDKYYHRDTFHKGNGAHLEVYNSRGNHLGEANPITGIITPNTLDKTKKLRL